LTTGAGLREAELAAAADEMAALEAAGASEVRRRFSAEKEASLADGPADLLAVCEALSVASAVLMGFVLGGVLIVKGSLPSALPTVGGVCWDSL